MKPIDWKFVELRGEPTAEKGLPAAFGFVDGRLRFCIELWKDEEGQDEYVATDRESADSSAVYTYLHNAILYCESWLDSDRGDDEA